MPTKTSKTKLRARTPGVLRLDDLIVEVAALCDLSDEEAERVVKAIFWSMIKALHHEDRVMVKGFGKFYVKTLPKRMRYNVKFGTRKEYPPKKVVSFMPYLYLAYLMNPELFHEKT